MRFAMPRFMPQGLFDQLAITHLMCVMSPVDAQDIIEQWEATLRHYVERPYPSENYLSLRQELLDSSEAINALVDTVEIRGPHYSALLHRLAKAVEADERRRRPFVKRIFGGTRFNYEKKQTSMRKDICKQNAGRALVRMMTMDFQSLEDESQTWLNQQMLAALSTLAGAESQAFPEDRTKDERKFGTMQSLNRKHWTDTLLIIYGLLCVLVLNLLLGQVVFDSLSFWGLVGFCLASAVSFLAGAGTMGSIRSGTTRQLIAGGVLGALLFFGCLWTAYLLGVVLATVMGLNIRGEFWIVVSALTGFVGATGTRI
jgi:hypothetical protein